MSKRDPFKKFIDNAFDAYRKDNRPAMKVADPRRDRTVYEEHQGRQMLFDLVEEADPIDPGQLTQAFTKEHWTKLDPNQKWEQMKEHGFKPKLLNELGRKQYLNYYYGHEQTPRPKRKHEMKGLYNPFFDGKKVEEKPPGQVTVLTRSGIAPAAVSWAPGGGGAGGGGPLIPIMDSGVAPDGARLRKRARAESEDSDDRQRGKRPKVGSTVILRKGQRTTGSFDDSKGLAEGERGKVVQIIGETTGLPEYCVESMSGKKLYREDQLTVVHLSTKNASGTRGTKAKPRWSCDSSGSGTFYAYEDEDNDAIEEMFKAGDGLSGPSSPIPLSFGTNHMYTFDFTTMEQVNTYTQLKRPIQRHPKPSAGKIAVLRAAGAAASGGGGGGAAAAAPGGGDGAEA